MSDRLAKIFCEKYEPKAPKDIKKEFVVELWDGTKIYLVNGDELRNKGNVSFIGGGHGYDANGVTPSDTGKKEIWVEKMKNPEDQIFILTHELFEWFQMKYHGVKYEKAHELANSVEHAVRTMANLAKKD